jgi:hypothetical protein
MDWYIALELAVIKNFRIREHHWYKDKFIYYNIIERRMKDQDERFYNINAIVEEIGLPTYWEIYNAPLKEKKPSEILLKLKGNERLEKAYSILDEMYEDIKKLKEK